ncbi:DNA translocase FtsK 4TM domain-containing protein [Wigglesworthia glossinidia]|uniref:DNA translocase FtsK 4TM domain-containing protein n=1 Tax=Wigglesworthia glossinidia TaxID=51229 RepID=UPI00031E99D0|nr:DNA translocase FtsK 4TM domain-containing protein [Wigglesworthia glossinidia]
MLKKIYFFDILIKLILIYLFLTIISFQEIDSNWFKISFQDTVVNFGGKFGAQLSATLFLFFGKITYIIPLVLYSIFWRFFF